MSTYSRIFEAVPIINRVRQVATTKTARGRGRPRNLNRRDRVQTCRKPGCSNPPVKGQAYCCRSHAPLGNYAKGEFWGYGATYAAIYSEIDDAEKKAKIPKGNRRHRLPPNDHVSLEPPHKNRPSLRLVDQKPTDWSQAVQLDFWGVSRVDSEIAELHSSKNGHGK